jgi:hypothetical protein
LEVKNKMTDRDAIKQFKSIYPEREIFVCKVDKVNDNNYIIEAEFPDGTFYFVVSPRTVSSSFNSRGRAKQFIEG